MQESFNLTGEDKPFIKGRHVVTIFHNDANLYSVVRVHVTETNLQLPESEAVITGYFPLMQEEEFYTFYGAMKEHPRFGIQFNVDTFQREMPTSEEGLIAYLSGPLFKGIGKKMATNIVEALGESAIAKIMESPSVLDTVPKLTSEKAKVIIDTLMENQGVEHAMIGLGDLGFGPQLSMKIFQVYQQQTMSILSENPFRLVEDVEGVGFTRADEVARQLGFDELHPSRVQAGILYVLDQVAMKQGHTFLEVTELLALVDQLLNRSQVAVVERDLVEDQLVILEQLGKLAYDEDRVALPSLYFAEKGISACVKSILGQEEFADQFPQSEFLLQLGKLEDRLQISYAEEQREAIYQALHSPMMILTGGPGTGKTTVIKGIVELFAELHGLSLDRHAYKDGEAFPIVLTAPTGRAAKRMAESTGLPAMTIHRLLGWNGVDGFQHDEDSPIAGRLVIVDESSMVDTWLMNQLLKSLPEQVQVILVGDEDQLPSVGPGQVLKDLLNSETIPVTRLKTIFRQGDGSEIIELAHYFRNGEVPYDLLRQKGDCTFISCGTNQVSQVVEQVVQNAAQKGYRAEDVQVLAPMYRGAAGIDALNKMLQEIFNQNSKKSKRELLFGDVTYRVGDKVLQLVNRPEDQIYNGDMGKIVSIIYAKENIDKQDLLYVSYDGVEVEYTRADFLQITHAFCCSIHKAQGSEFPIVILPVVKGYHRMLRRNLIYTAITRSMHYLIICGEMEALQYAIQNHVEDERKTMLKARLVGEEVQSEVVEKKDALSYEQKLMLVDPLIGMEGISPYDFLSP